MKKLKNKKNSKKSIANFQKKKFEEDGFVILKKVIPEQMIDKINLFLSKERIVLESIMINEGINLKKITNDDLNKINKTFSTDKKNFFRNVITGNFPKKIKGNEIFNDLFKSRKFQEKIKLLLNSEKLFMHIFPSPRHISKKNNLSIVPLHTDSQYNPHLKKFVTVWVPINVFEKKMGGILVIPRSHRTHRIKSEIRKDGLWFESVKTIKEKLHYFQMSKGDIMVMNQNLIHGSMKNNSNKIRFSIDARFFGNEFYSTKHFLNLQTGVISKNTIN